MGTLEDRMRDAQICTEKPIKDIKIKITAQRTYEVYLSEHFL